MERPTSKHDQNYAIIQAKNKVILCKNQACFFKFYEKLVASSFDRNLYFWLEPE